MSEHYWEPEIHEMVWVKAIGVWFGQVGAVVHTDGRWFSVRLRMWDPITKRMKREVVMPKERWMTVEFLLSEIGPAVPEGTRWTAPLKTKEGGKRQDDP